MPLQRLHSPAAAAKLISRPPNDRRVNVHTLRRWCALHAEFLSPGANPNRDKEEDAPEAARWLTERDVEVLRTVAQLRAQGESTTAINDKLRTMSFAVVADEDDNVDNPDDNPLVNLNTPATNAQEGRSGDFPLAIALSSMEKRQDATDARVATVDKRVDDLQRAVAMLETRQAQRIDALVTGIMIGVMVAFIVGAVALTLGS